MMLLFKWKLTAVACPYLGTGRRVFQNLMLAVSTNLLYVYLGQSSQSVSDAGEASCDEVRLYAGY